MLNTALCECMHSVMIVVYFYLVFCYVSSAIPVSHCSHNLILIV